MECYYCLQCGGLAPAQVYFVPALVDTTMAGTVYTPVPIMGMVDSWVRAPHLYPLVHRTQMLSRTPTPRTLEIIALVREEIH